MMLLSCETPYWTADERDDPQTLSAELLRTGAIPGAAVQEMFEVAL